MGKLMDGIMTEMELSMSISRTDNVSTFGETQTETELRNASFAVRSKM
jgi:hypothetical protein